MIALKTKISLAMNELQTLMESNVHLKDFLKAATVIDNAAKYWSVLSEEDREYVDAARYALNEQLPWKVEK